MASFKPHHLSIGPEHTQGNGGVGRLFFLPGSDGRARRIAERFTDVEEVGSDRQLNVHLGRVPTEAGPVDVGAVATGMGCPSLDIVATELILLGARTLIRVGTAGSMQPDRVRVGDLVVATAAVRDEGTSDRYVGVEYPAIADPDVVRALESAAARSGMGERTFSGVVHTKDSLFAREMGHGPLQEANRAYMEQLHGLGVLASEMESAHLFVLSHVHSGAASAARIRAGALLAIIGDQTAFAAKEQAAVAEKAAIDVAIESAADLAG